MCNQKDIYPEVLEKIVNNYNEILDAEKNHPENVVTLSSIEEIEEYFNSL